MGMPACGKATVVSCRVAMLDNSYRWSEQDRMGCWNDNITVLASPKEVIQWVNGQPDWPLPEPEEDAANNTDDEDPADEGYEDNKDSKAAQLSPLRTVSDGSQRLERLKSALNLCEQRKAILMSSNERSESTAHQELSLRNAAFVAAIESRVKVLSEAKDKLKSLLGNAASGGAAKNVRTEGNDDSVDDDGQDYYDLPDSLVVSSARVLARIDDNATNSDAAVQPWEESSLRSALHTLELETMALDQMALAAKILAMVPLHHKKLLNFAHDWLCTFLPHCMAKVNRVSFGLLTESECRSALRKEPNMPRSRLKLAVPFLGKDVPSTSSEFAHPDVIIGLTIMAYRYSGLRQTDFNTVMDSLTSEFVNDIGPAADRSSNIRYNGWVLRSGGVIRGYVAPPGSELPEPDLAGAADPNKRLDAASGQWLDKEAFLERYGGLNEWASSKKDVVDVVQLKFLQKSNEDQMRSLFDLWVKSPQVVHRYLARTVFPTHMRSQQQKISASGQAVGGDMLFGRRVGFSGTPSDLLPKEMGQCDYETGDDGKMLSTVLDEYIMGHAHLESGWSVEAFLTTIATQGGNDPDARFHALIDTGALVTGYTNRQVAYQLLRRGLKWCEGVVFLDELDKQQVLVRATGRVVPADIQDRSASEVSKMIQQFMDAKNKAAPVSPSQIDPDFFNK